MASHGDEHPARDQQTSAEDRSQSESDAGSHWYFTVDEGIDDDEDDADYVDAPDELDDDDDLEDEPRNIEFQVTFGNDDDEEIEIDQESDEADDDEDGEDDGDDFDEDDAQHLPAGVTTESALRFLTLLRGHRFIEEQNDDELQRIFGWGRSRRRATKDPNRFPKVPSVEGRKLMHSGAFGSSNEPIRHSARKRMARRMLERELGIGDRRQRNRNTDLIAQSLVPSTKAEQIIHYDEPIYSGQFSDDGNFFFSVCQDFKVRMYDTSNPYRWQHYKTVSYPGGQWTLTDASLSPDNKWLAYTSIDSLVSIAPTDPNDRGDPYALNLADGIRRANGWGFHRGGFGIWSIRFSGDGRELVAGTNAHSLVVYDIESRQVLHHIEGHEDDVNAVCFADKMSPHILYSGSDDATIKVWDRRSMGDGREVGAFVGHIEGLTYIDSKGDGRYILSNGKDQSMKLWDLRMALSTHRFETVRYAHQANASGFDYRTEIYDEYDWDVHPNDNSLVTFRGHKVLRTLIRCHFSPPSATNSRYVYSGSADGKVYVYNMDATIAQIIDVKQATAGTRRFDRHTRLYFDESSGWNTCVRDASWNPNAPVIVASAWNGYNMARGTCTVHSFNEADEDEGEPGMGRSVDHMLKDNPNFYPSQ
ncbi:WD repeat protein [Cordyceps fumosorosea ARSEF 2679]|uniref:WD repeat protein n=1 Tax=Cordyceps fumosorosea (strain ARSEF 2679) TaxID=1081104 RepID=A0A167SY94_CORFA|nr:WD repeat protein [Cordyceps fumosorosea ARSEF 2679]OAA60057.1 WD repeat protein [Cordyceps fumosorosea ARSEF 2679]